VSIQTLEGDTFDEDNDEILNADIPLESRVYLWQDKFRPRKPRYFNRVITGFEWNKYNKTHYDPDNPPPKVVLGYKFNVSITLCVCVIFSSNSLLCIRSFIRI